jgi:hypothetical protein
LTYICETCGTEIVVDDDGSDEPTTAARQWTFNRLVDEHEATHG